MIFRIRQCCCALTTFVRLVAIFCLVFHLLLVLSSAIWYTLFSNAAIEDDSETPEDAEAGEVNDETFDSFLHGKRNDSLDLLIVILLSVFASIGILVNVLVLLGIKLSQRSLFLPWLVFHLMAVVGKPLIILKLRKIPVTILITINSEKKRNDLNRAQVHKQILY